MKRVALSSIVVLAALLSACAIAPTDLSGIKVGATRATVEGVLGKPVKSVQTDSGRIDTYKYNTGYNAGAAAPPGFGQLDLLLAPVYGLIVYAGQRRDVEVTYGLDDTVVGRDWVPGNIDQARLAARYKEEARKRRDEILPRAEQGDVEAQFRVALLSSSADEKWKWLCLAANQGHADAQFSLGLGKELGFESDRIAGASGPGKGGHRALLFLPYERDHAGAYMWYSLASSQGHDLAAQNRRRVAKKMTPEQMAEAERLAAEWKPGDCGAEGRRAKSTK